MWQGFFIKLSPFRSMRGRYSAAMGASGIVFGLLLTGLMQWRWEVSAKNVEYEALHQIAHRIARHLDLDLAHRKEELHLASDLLLRSKLASPVEIRALLDNLQGSQPEYAWIGLADSKGKVIAASAGLLEQQDVSARPWFSGGQQRVFFGDPHPAELLASVMPPSSAGEPLRFVDVAMPVKLAGESKPGVLGAHLHWHWVRSVIETNLELTNSHKHIEVLVADQKGEWLLKPASETAGNLAALNKQTTPSDYFSAQASIQAPASEQGLGWVVIVRETTAHAFADIHQTRLLMLWLSMTLAACFAAIAWLISGRLVRPIEALADQARAHQNARGLSADSAQAHRPRDETGMLGHVMHQLAFYDRITGLANRRLLMERLEQALSDNAGTRNHGGLILINLDHFSLLNDTRGHEVGDTMLVEVAQRLLALVRPQDTLARLGGDEFAFLLGSLGPNRDKAKQEISVIAGQILQGFREPFELVGESYLGKASIGIKLFVGGHISAADVFKHADVAMFEAKRAGRDRCQFFDDSLQTLVDERFQLERDLRKGIPDELLLMYQKQVDSQGHIFGAELLVRWNHPVQGMVPPAKFIPLAEETGLILELGQWVLETACAQIKRWEQHSSTRQLVVSVNVSAKEFSQARYVDSVVSALKRTSADPTRLKLEMTESILAADIGLVVQKMNALRAIGVSFSLDDFGTGFSSLAYLKKMPLDQLKIDQSFVHDLTSHANAASIVRTVIDLGQSLGLEVIAEGVETLEQQNFLEVCGCHLFQGYLFSKPVTLEEFEKQVLG
jgi:diguanylate cyclase (GGDEF)-like protein